MTNIRMQQAGGLKDWYLRKHTVTVTHGTLDEDAFRLVFFFLNAVTFLVPIEDIPSFRLVY